MRSEDYFADADTVLQLTFRFLGLRPFSVKRHMRSIKVDYEDMNRDTRANLIDYFRPYNEELREATQGAIKWDY